jgi:hypothetical protein
VPVSLLPILAFVVLCSRWIVKDRPSRTAPDAAFKTASGVNS